MVLKPKITGFFLSVPFLFLVACQSQKAAERPLPEQPPPRKDSQLVLNNATLEQANAEGQTLWKIQVESAVYTPDKQKAQLTKVRGNLLEKGKVVLQISADAGEISRNGENVVLKDNVIAIDPRNQASLRSNAVEWQPQQSLLLLTQPLKGTQKELNVSAQQAQYNTQKQQLTLKGKITAIAPNPRLQLQSESLVWELSQKKASSDRPIHMARFEGKTITDELDAQSAEVDLAQKVAIARQPVNYKSTDPPIQARAESLTWDYKNRIIESATPIQLVQYRDRMTMTGNHSVVNFATRLAVLSQGARGRNDRKPATLYAQTITWNMDSQYVEALGNVIYQQSEPKFNLTGEKASGILSNNLITVEGTPQNRVVTEIYPKNP